MKNRWREECLKCSPPQSPQFKPLWYCRCPCTRLLCPPAKDTQSSRRMKVIRPPVRRSRLFKVASLPFAGSPPEREGKKERSGQYCHVKPEIGVQQVQRCFHTLPYLLSHSPQWLLLTKYRNSKKSLKYCDFRCTGKINFAKILR